MAITIQARKRARQAEVRRERNVSQKSKLRTFVKNVEKLVDAKKVEDASDMLTKAIPVIDSSVSKGLIHKNKAARTKSRLNKRVKALAKK